MFVKKTNGYVIRNNRISTTKFLQALLVDWIADANVHFLNWVVVEDEKLCVQCKNMWGKVYERHNLVFHFRLYTLIVDVLYNRFKQLKLEPQLTSIYLRSPDEYGMRRISIIPGVTETAKEYYTPMTD